jgi:hypothetical protein
LCIERLVGGYAGGELLGVTDHEVLKLRVLGGAIGMRGEVVDLCAWIFSARCFGV